MQFYSQKSESLSRSSHIHENPTHSNFDKKSSSRFSSFFQPQLPNSPHIVTKKAYREDSKSSQSNTQQATPPYSSTPNSRFLEKTHSQDIKPLNSKAMELTPAKKSNPSKHRRKMDRAIPEPQEFESSSSSEEDIDSEVSDIDSSTDEEVYAREDTNLKQERKVAKMMQNTSQSHEQISHSKSKSKSKSKIKSNPKNKHKQDARPRPFNSDRTKSRSRDGLDENYPGSNYVYYMGQVASKVMTDQILWKHLIIAYKFNVYTIQDFSTVPSDSINNINKCKNFIVSHLVKNGCGELCELFRSSKLAFIDANLDFSGPTQFTCIKERQMIEVLHSDSARILDSSVVSGTIPTNSSDWLKKIGLEDYIDVFNREGLSTVDAILKLTDSDIKDLGIKIGHRAKFHEEINRLKMIQTKNEDTSSAKQEPDISKILKIDRAKDDLCQTQKEMNEMLAQMKTMMNVARVIQSESTLATQETPTAASSDPGKKGAADPPETVKVSENKTQEVDVTF